MTQETMVSLGNEAFDIGVEIMQEAIAMQASAAQGSRADDMLMSRFRREIEALSLKVLKQFFAGKVGDDGLPIPEESFTSPEDVSLVLNTEMSDGIDRFYRETAGNGSSDQNTRYLVSVLHEARRLGIPKTLISGIACVHARVVGRWVPEGVSLLELPVEEDWDEDDVEPDDFELSLVACEEAAETFRMPSMGFASFGSIHCW